MRLHWPGGETLVRDMARRIDVPVLLVLRFSTANALAPGSVRGMS